MSKKEKGAFGSLGGGWESMEVCGEGLKIWGSSGVQVRVLGRFLLGMVWYGTV